MKQLACLATAVAALVVSLCTSAGAEDPLPFNGSISITNRSSYPVIVDIVDGAASSVAPTGATLLLPKKTLKAKKLDRLADYYFVFDADLDFVADSASTINLDGTKSYKGTIGDFGFISILP